MESVGSRLKNLRLEKGLTLEEVHKKTKVHLNILKAIEDDSLIGLNPVYIKGFIKIYCKLLGVDPKDYIPADYKEPQAIPKSLELSDAGQRLGLFIKTGLIRLGSFSRGIRIRRKSVLIIIAFLALAFVLFNLGKFFSTRRSKAPEKVSKIPMTVVQRSEAAKIKKETLSVIRLGLRAKEDCWVDLKVDGRTVFHTILKKGKFESWRAKDKMELSLGNAGVVELELDGRAILPLGRRGQVIKGIRITKDEGLVVPR